MLAGLRRWIRRAALLVRRDAVERSMEAEMRDHIDCEIADRIRQGMTPAEARRTALADFGGVESTKEAGRDARGTRPFEDALLDIRYAARVLRRHPGFTAAAVLTFALGCGGAGAIVTLVHGVLLRPLPYAHHDRLVVLWERNVPRNRDQNVVSVENYEAWRARNRSFDAMAALVPSPVTIDEGGAPARVIGAEVTPGYFDLLGIAPALGREFASDDAVAGAPGAVILSDGYWRRRFGGDPSAIGRALTIGGRPHTIVGVMPPFEPPRFGWLGEQQLWMAFAPTPATHSWGRFLLVVARLRPDVTVDQARAEMLAIADQRAKDDPANAGWSASVVPLREQITEGAQSPLLVLLGAVTLLLAMAIANVTLLTLSLTRRRGPELSMRRAIGATDDRLFRQLLTQNALLGTVGGAVSVAAAAAGVQVLLVLLPPDMPRLESIRFDRAALSLIGAVVLGATAVFGGLTAWVGARASRSSATGLDETETRSSARTGSGSLVTVEVALALALSVMAFLMTQSFIALRQVDLGFEADGVVFSKLAVPPDRYPSPESRRTFFATLLEEIRTIPGVRAASLISVRPFGGIGVATTVADPAQAATTASAGVVADIRYVEAGYFDALRIRQRAGAAFGDGEAVAEPPQAVVSAATAGALWPGANPIGRRLHVKLFNGLDTTVAGVVDDVHLMDARTPPRPVVYLSAQRFPSTQQDLVLRVDGPSESVIPALRARVAALEPGSPLYLVDELARLVDRSLAADRFATVILVVFAAIALTLAGVGIFGISSGEVARRRKEIGIRLALGARPLGILALLLRQSVPRTLSGIGIGCLLAVGLARSMKALLFGVQPVDPASFVAVSLLLAAIAASATIAPAVRSTRGSIQAIRDV